MKSNHTKLLFLTEVRRLPNDKKLLPVFEVVDEIRIFLLEHNTLVGHFTHS